MDKQKIKLCKVFILSCLLCILFSVNVYALSGPTFYSNSNSFIKSNGDSFQVLILGNNNKLYALGQIQSKPLGLQKEMYDTGNLFAWGYVMEKTDDNGIIASGTPRFDKPTVLAENVVDFGIFFSGEYDSFQTLYYLMNNNRLYCIEKNSYRLLMSDVVKISCKEDYNQAFAIDINGNLYNLCKIDGEYETEFNFMGALNSNIDINKIKQFNVANSLGNAGEILLDNGELWVWSDGIAMDNAQLLHTNADDYYFGAEYKFIKTLDDKLYCLGTDPINNITYDEWTEITDDVKDFDVVISLDCNDIVVLKNDGSLWVCGNNDVLMLGSLSNISSQDFVKTEENVREYVVSLYNWNYPYSNYILKNDGVLSGNRNIITKNNLDESKTDTEYSVIAENVEKINYYGFMNGGSVNDGMALLKDDGSLELIGYTSLLSLNKPANYALYPICMFTDFDNGVVNDVELRNYNYEMQFDKEADKNNSDDMPEKEYKNITNLYLMLSVITVLFAAVYAVIIVKDKIRN